MPVTIADVGKPDPKGSRKEWLYFVDGMYYYKDFLCMPDCTPEVMSWMESDLTFEDGDVIIAGYPASGINWLQELVWHMKGRVDQIGKDKDMDLGSRVNFMEHEHFGRPPWHFLKDVPPGQRVFKSHLPARFLKERIMKGKVRVIHWFMNPRNNLAKYHFLYNTKGKHLNYPSVEWNTFYEMFKAEQLCEGDWFDTVQSYLPLISLPNVLTLRYEDVAADKRKGVERIADFLGLKFTPEEIDKLEKVAPFDKPGNPAACFSPEQMEEFNKIYAKKMKGSFLEEEYATS